MERARKQEVHEIQLIFTKELNQEGKMEEKYTQQDFQMSRKSYPFRGTIF